MRKQISPPLSLSLPLFLSLFLILYFFFLFLLLSFSLPSPSLPLPSSHWDLSHPLCSTYKSFSSGNSTAREMKFMNSNAARTFLFLVKGRKRIRETLNSVTSTGSMGREQPITFIGRSKE